MNCIELNFAVPLRLLVQMDAKWELVNVGSVGFHSDSLKVDRDLMSGCTLWKED